MPLFLGIPRRRPKEPAEDAKSYFKHLAATYYALTPEERKKNPELARRIDTFIDAAENDAALLTWDYLFELEYMILRLMPKEMIARKKWVIRERFEEAVGEQGYQEYLGTQPPDKPEEALLADLGILLDDLFWRHKLHTLWERQWKRLVTGIAVGFAGVAAAIVAIAAVWGLVAVPKRVDVTMLKAGVALAAVALVGMAGSLVSLIQRYQSVPSEKKRTVNLIGIENGRALVLQSLMTGAVFALLMPLLFGSGMLNGELFPDIAWDKTSFLAGLAALLANGKQFAMLLIWCFVAGFAERLVPDILNRLTPKTAPGEAGKDPQVRSGLTTVRLAEQIVSGASERLMEVTASATAPLSRKTEAETAVPAEPEPAMVKG